MTQFGVYDRAQKAWLYICDTFEDAEKALLAADVSTAAVYPVLDGDPAGPAPAPVLEPAASDPQEEVAVVTGRKATPAAEPAAPETPAAPDVAADVVA